MPHITKAVPTSLGGEKVVREEDSWSSEGDGMEKVTAPKVQERAFD